MNEQIQNWMIQRTFKKQNLYMMVRFQTSAKVAILVAVPQRSGTELSLRPPSSKYKLKDTNLKNSVNVYTFDLKYASVSYDDGATRQADRHIHLYTSIWRHIHVYILCTYIHMYIHMHMRVQI